MLKYGYCRLRKQFISCFWVNFVYTNQHMRQIICTLLLGMICFGVSAQEVYNSSGRAGGYRKKEKKGYDPDKLVLGGGLNANYARIQLDDYTSGSYVQFGISPKVGYRLARFLTVGVGVGYQYYKSPDYVAYIQNTPKIAYTHYNIYYPGVWAKCFVYNPIFISADFEFDVTRVREYRLMYDAFGQPDHLVTKRSTVTAPCALVGAGFRQSLGGRTSATFEIMYDLLQADYSPYYGTLVYRAGIYVGL